MTYEGVVESSVALSRQSRVDKAYVQQSAQELWDAFEPWRRDIDELQQVKSMRPWVDTHAAFSGLSATRLEQSQRRFTEGVTGRIKAILDNYIARQFGAPCQIEALAISDDRAEQARQAQYLDFCNEILRYFDGPVSRSAAGWLELVATLGGFPGKPIAFVHLVKGRDGYAMPTAELWDPMTVAHDLNDSDCYRVVHRVIMGRGEARAYLAAQETPGQTAFRMPDMGGVKPDEPVTLTDVWIAERNDGEGDEYDVYRGILVDGTVAGIQLTGFDRMPIKLRPSHATVQAFGGPHPQAQTGNPRGVTREAIVEHCQPFWAGLKHIQETRKAALSIVFAGLFRALDPAYLIRSQEGNVDIPDAQLVPHGKTLATMDVEVKAVDWAVGEIDAALKALMESLNIEFDIVYNPALRGQMQGNPSGCALAITTSHSATS